MDLREIRAFTDARELGNYEQNNNTIVTPVSFCPTFIYIWGSRKVYVEKRCLIYSYLTMLNNNAKSHHCETFNKMISCLK